MRSIVAMRDFPADRVHCIMDTAAVAGIARELGIMHRIAGATSLALANVGYLYRVHPTHWLGFICATGQSEAGENGLMLCSYPKSLLTLEQVKRLHESAVKCE